MTKKCEECRWWRDKGAIGICTNFKVKDELKGSKEPACNYYKEKNGN